MRSRPPSSSRRLRRFPPRSTYPGLTSWQSRARCDAPGRAACRASALRRGMRLAIRAIIGNRGVALKCPPVLARRSLRHRAARSAARHSQTESNPVRMSPGRRVSPSNLPVKTSPNVRASRRDQPIRAISRNVAHRPTPRAPSQKSPRRSKAARAQDANRRLYASIQRRARERSAVARRMRLPARPTRRGVVADGAVIKPMATKRVPARRGLPDRGLASSRRRRLPALPFRQRQAGAVRHRDSIRKAGKVLIKRCP